MVENMPMKFLSKRKFHCFIVVLSLLAASISYARSGLHGFNSTQPLNQLIQSGDNVLFIGNSLIYYSGGLNNRLFDFTKKMNIPCSINSSTIGASTVSQHVEDSTLERLFINNKGSFTKVIFQGQSGEAISTNQNDTTLLKFKSSVRAMAEKIRLYNPNCKIFLFAHASSSFDIEKTKTIYENYKDIGDKIGAIVVPAGQAWLNFISAGGNIHSLFFDNKHPSEAGRDLNACVFYGVLFGRNPQELPVKKPIKDAAEKTLIEYGFLSRNISDKP
jgi:hypothetical protein